MLKQYKIERKDGKVVCTVHTHISKYELQHVTLHSPTGFETGYGGSGPADLAASILADYIGVSSIDVEKTWKDMLIQELPRHAARVIALHQDFKWTFISPGQIEDGESYIINADEIDRWLHEKQFGTPEKSPEGKTA